MPLSKEQIASLLQTVSSATQDILDCDSCYRHIAEFADIELAGKEIPDALKSVETHLKQCKCCQDEYQTLLEGLRTLEGGS